MSSSAHVEIENKYGNVIIETWDKDSVLFDVQITVYADSDGDAFYLLDQLVKDRKMAIGHLVAFWEPSAVELNGIEPSTSGLQSPRSPS